MSNEWISIPNIKEEDSLRCYRCKRVSPDCGFYPMMYQGGGTIVDGKWKIEGGLLCWDCDREMRAEK